MLKFKPLIGLALVFLLLTSFLLAACGDSTSANTAASGTNAAASGAKGKVVVSSKDFTESILVAEMYAAALENAGIPVERKMNLGSTDITQQAILKGDISLYPEYTGTSLLVVLKLPKDSNDPKVVYDKVAKEYASQYKLAVLDPAPFNDTTAIVVTKAVAQKYNLKTLSDLSTKASELRFAAIPDFIGSRSEIDGLKSLQKTYGGFNFKDVKSYEIKLKYKALISGDADAAIAFSTDGDIAGNGFVLLEDDKLNFPPYQVAPIIRQETLDAYPNLKTILNAVSAKLTNDKISALNWKVDGPDKQEAVDVAKTFLKAEGLIK
ncbi:MAG: hypothetical protein HXX20_09125 [Chloroflexi bacterium]|nr:hypothetical protein [Chloroflexota bacterium]